jgi:pyroglutamyl-peptidase
MLRVLATGFEPFGGSTVNPSQELVKALGGDTPTAILPVSYERAADVLRRAVRETEPDAVLCFGQADGRTGISIERFAHNLDEATTTDNAAAPGSGTAIDAGGPAAYPSTLPVDELVAALRAEGIPTAPSRDAGGFLCNHVFYVLMGLLKEERPRAIGGFVHVPLLPEQALVDGGASMPLETLVRAARILLRSLAESRYNPDT